MYKSIVLIPALLLMLTFSCKTPKKQEFQWSLEQESVHNENRNDSTKWSSKIWKEDTRDIALEGAPILNGVFPIPKYELADSTFDGLGYSGNWKGLGLDDKKIIYHALYVKKSAVNRQFIKDQPNEVFFTIAVLTDSIDLKGYSHTDVDITSRNHPHYVGQGFVKTRSNEIDFLAFLTADRNNYAIVNMRLFDLRIGRIILIAPKKDGTMRSLQLQSPIMSSEEMDAYMTNLISNDKSVIDFFTKNDNI